MATTDRRYEVKALIGRGGFGKVYVATLRAADGFTKEVAIKILRDAEPSAEAMERFRDEARLLGMIRDRSVVQVDPPTRLSGRWSVVMEYVDGASMYRILRAHKLVPPAVALSVVREVAGVLDRLWNHPSPEGRPLQLRHRDIKPSNLQIRPDGSVVVLDFGIAKACFDARESLTTTGVAGSDGYIAPERLRGEDGPTTDVYSLGVVLFEMITGSRPTVVRRDRVESDELRAQALSLAVEMIATVPTDRPSAREVERRCGQLLQNLPSTLVREWAAASVPAESRLPDDELVGEMLSEGPTDAAPTTDATVRTAVVATGAALMSSLVVAGLLAMLGVAGVALFLSMQLSSTVGLEPLDRVQPAPAAPAERGPSPAPPPPVPEAAGPPRPEAPSLEVVPAPAPPSNQPPTDPAGGVPGAPGAPSASVPAPEQEPAAPAAPTPAPAVDAPRAAEVTHRVSFGSLPPDATVSIDGAVVGITPVVGWTLTEGPHTVTLRFGERSITRTIHVDRRASSRYLWRIESDLWEGSR